MARCYKCGASDTAMKCICEKCAQVTNSEEIEYIRRKVIGGETIRRAEVKELFKEIDRLSGKKE